MYKNGTFALNQRACSYGLNNSLSAFCSKADAQQNSRITPISSGKLSNLGWKPRALEETLLDSIEYHRKMGNLQDVEGQAYRLPDIFRHFQAAAE